MHVLFLIGWRPEKPGAGAKVFAVPGLLPLEEELAAKCTCISSLYELLDLLD